MTPQQTRTLADYPVGSRWRTEEGREVMILRHDPTGNNWPLLSIDLETMGVAGSFVDGLDWTRIDEPAPATDALREAARDAMNLISLYRDRLPDAAMERVHGALAAALAQPAPASEPRTDTDIRDERRAPMPNLADIARQFPANPAPPADDRRWQAALAVYPVILRLVVDGLLARGDKRAPTTADLASDAFAYADALIAAMEGGEG